MERFRLARFAILFFILQDINVRIVLNPMKTNRRYSRLKVKVKVKVKVEDVNQCNSVEIELNEVFQMQENDEGVLDSACTSNVMGRK